jgi:F-type H+-transporting ATPase subunit epsilon
MNGPVFILNIVTPSVIMERKIQALRLADETGSFGILKGHTDFLTVLQPSLGYYIDAEGKETFLAVDGGILTIRKGAVTLTTRELFESPDADKLAMLMKQAIQKREKNERSFYSMLQGIEKSFIEKTVSLGRDRT